MAVINGVEISAARLEVHQLVEGTVLVDAEQGTGIEVGRQELAMGIALQPVEIANRAAIAEVLDLLGLAKGASRKNYRDRGDRV